MHVVHGRAVALAAAALFVCQYAEAGGGRGGAPPEGKSIATKERKAGGAPSPQSAAASSPGVAAPNAVRAATADELVFGAPIQYQNITIVPVGTTSKGPFRRYTLMEEGLAAKTFAIREMHGHSGEAQVNAVEVKNTGNQPVYLLGGEMILGGKQDRILSRDTVVAPGKQWVSVPVFCVEAHRWEGQNMEFASGGAIAHVSLREAALSGDQSKVWAEVARKNLQHGTESASGTYRRTIQNATLRKRIAPYREAIERLMPKDIQVAGIVFGVNGEIKVADLFGNPVLYGSLRDKLLSAYVLEALGESVDHHAAPVSLDAAKGFLLQSRKAGKVAQPSAGRSVNYKKEDAQMVGSETLDADGAEVRETYIKKK